MSLDSLLRAWNPRHPPVRNVGSNHPHSAAVQVGVQAGDRPVDMLVAEEPEAQTVETVDADVALAASGDRHAFERLYRLHVDRVHALCLRMVNHRPRAEELTQDVFVRAWEKLGQFRGESAFGTWLHRLTVNLVLNARRQEGRARLREAEEPETLELLPARAGTADGTRVDLDRAMARLPAGARRIFVLHDVEGFKHEEIADMLSITAGGSKAQLHRARMLLRNSLQQ